MPELYELDPNQKCPLLLYESDHTETVHLVEPMPSGETGSLLLYSCVTACPPSLGEVLMGDYAAATIRRSFDDTHDDEGSPILWTLLTRPAHVGTPDDRAYFRRMTVKVTDAASHQQIQTRTIFGPITAGQPRVIDRTLRAPANAPIGIGPSNVLYNTEADIDMALGLTATNCRAILAGYGRIRIRAIEYQVRTKPLTVPSVYS